MLSAQTLLPWLPALLVALLGAAALVFTAMPGSGRTGRRLRLVGIAGIAALTLAASLWQTSTTRARIARLVRNDPAKELAVRVNSLEAQVAALKESTHVRTLGAEAAGKLADYLRGFGSRAIVVSCAPGDIEAYRYATEIANALKAAGWDARGPETTTIFGDIRGMAVNVYDNGGRAPDTVKILLDALAKFGIPYQSRVPPSEAMPATDAVELFIGRKPAPPGLAAAEPAR